MNMKLHLEKSVCNLEVAGCMTLGNWKHVAHFWFMPWFALHCSGDGNDAFEKDFVIHSYRQLWAEAHY